MQNKITPESIVVLILLVILGIFWFNIDNIVVTPKKLENNVISRIESIEHRLNNASKDKNGNVQNIEKTIDGLINNVQYLKETK